MDEEIWKPVPGFDGYEVSNMGRVRSYRVPAGPGCGWVVRRDRPPRILRASPNSQGRPNVTLCADGVKYDRTVHRLVLEAFVGPRPPGMEACHADDNPLNNRLDNLRWDTNWSNIQDRHKNGGYMKSAEKFKAYVAQNGHPATRLTRDEVIGIVTDHLVKGMTQREVAEKYGVTHTHVGYICAGKTRFQDLIGSDVESLVAERMAA